MGFYEKKIKSYGTSLSSDGSMILNIAASVSLLKAEGSKIVEVFAFHKMKNPSVGVIASDLSTLAYKNTSGRVAIHDCKTGKLLLEHEAINHEGCGIHYIFQNHRILSSTWNCDIYMINIINGDIITSKLGNGECRGGKILPGMTDSEFFVHYSQPEEHRSLRNLYSTIAKLIVKGNGFDILPTQIKMPVCNTLTPTRVQNSLLFSSRLDADSKLYSYDLVRNTFDEIFSVRDVISSAEGGYNNDLLQVTYIHGTKNGRFIIIVCDWKTIIIIETLKRKCVATISHNFVSNVLLYGNDRYLWVGTWNKPIVYDFLELIGEEPTNS